MITYTTSKTDEDLSQILELQKKNLPQNLTEAEIKSQGFVTVNHSFKDLKDLNAHEQHLIIRDGAKLAGYILAMTKKSRDAIPVLVPMFEVFDRISYKNKAISEYNYLVVGQVCIGKDYRGQGLFDKGYEAYRKRYRDKYDFAITEIAITNTRSINAHKRVGFVEVHHYRDVNGIDWVIVVWNWQHPEPRTDAWQLKQQPA